MSKEKLTERKWFYPAVYGLLIIISMLPPITEQPYDPRNTQDVIMSILMVSIAPYQAWGWVFHIATIAVIALAALRPEIGGRAIAAYFGINYLLIAFLQNMAMTETYGFAIMISALIATTLIGLLWLWVAWQDKLHASFEEIPRWSWSLLPLALLVFWSPIALEGNRVVPNFNPRLLLTSPDYGLAYCFVTPAFLFLLILFYPQVPMLAFRVTAFNGLLYGLFNLTHWLSPATHWMGVMHIPLLVIPLAALLMPKLERLPQPQRT